MRSKEIDPNNPGSVVLGSVAYYMDRYGYDVLSLALRLLMVNCFHRAR